MRKLIFFTGILAASLILYSCEDFLSVEPKTEIGGDTFFNSAADLEMYLNGLIDWPGFPEGIHLEASDDATSSGSVEFRNIMLNDVTSRQITTGWEWEQLRDINYFLENFENADINQQELNHYEGIARFHRAKFYMEKVQRFNGVPWYDKVLETNDEDLYKPRDSREFVVDKIFEDYAFAAEHVRPSSETGAVNLWVVKTYMARHALFEGTFRKYHDYLDVETPADEFLQIARDQALDIIENGGFELHNTGNPNEDYGSLFKSPDLTGNPEVILLNRSIEGEKDSEWWANGFGNYEQSPTKDLVQTYLMDDGSYYSDQPGWEENDFLEEFENRDPRLYQTIAYPGWVIENTGTYAPGTSGEPFIQVMNRFFTGYHMLKWFVNNDDEIYQANIDVPVLRYAEVLLTYAEARAELGELNQADLDMTINLLRDRAGVPHMSMGQQAGQVQQDRYPNVSSPELLEIRRERRVELPFESHRLTDLMRYRAGELLERLPKGIYFPSLGAHDLTGDGNDDIMLIPHTEEIPPTEDRETNDDGDMLNYYRAGPFGSDATVFLENGDHGAILARNDRGTFEDPKHYFRPIPFRDTQINPELEQIFGWE